MRLRSSSILAIVAVALPLACSVYGCTSTGRPANRADHPAGDALGKPVSVTAPPAERATLQSLEAERAASQSMTTAELERRYAVPFRDSLPYAPLDAKGLDVIEAKGVPLPPAERARLARDGFTLLPAVRHPTFALAYADAFQRHLPVYLSADSILFAVHKSFAALLKTTEASLLTRDLGLVLGGMRDRLKAGALGNASRDVVADVDDYLAVATSLLEGQAVAPVASGHAGAVKTLVARAISADGMGTVSLFGAPREVDFSRFKPRGHYLGVPERERYFRAMMWLSRTDFRALETKPDGAQLFERRQLEAAFALRDLMDDGTRAAWTRIDRTLEAFVGERDEMSVRDLDTLARELGIQNAAGLAGKTDDAVASTLARTGLGQQRIASQLVTRSPDAKGTLPLHTSFALMNQRYTLDAHVLSNVAYDRVRSGMVKRMMPDPLDVGFAALGNNGAAELLRGELDHFGYAPDLHMMRVLASAHGDDYWQSSLYTTWESAIRALSPTEEALKPSAAGGLPSVAATRAWNARILSTQLASWAELRHDTVLYAKQSYSSMALCEFPDAYVDPYPEVFHRIALHARLGRTLTAEVLSADPALEAVAKKYFTRLDEIATQLERMAAQERAGTPFTKEQMDFVNEMVSARRIGCGGPPAFSGWYGDLFVDRTDLHEFAPTITDVHTQPADENGNPVGRILHVGTGFVNEMVVTVDSCHGPRAYAGYVSSYYEKTTEHFDRLTDPQWESELQRMPWPQAPEWMSKLLPR